MAVRIIIAAILLAGLRCAGIGNGFAYLLPYALVGADVWREMVEHLREGVVCDENFLMAVATVGAFALGDCSEAVLVMLLYQTGESLQDMAVDRSRRDIAQLMDLRPDHANLLGDDGTLRVTNPEAVRVGSVIVVKPGERVPLDGLVLEGASTLDTSALTGEAKPRRVAVGDAVLSGCVNRDGVLRVRTSKTAGQSTAATVLALVEESADKKSRAEEFIRRFARLYTPAVCAAAVALALVVPLLTGEAWSLWLPRALTFLVISCPCALVISVPLTFFAGIGAASRAGVLVKGASFLESLARLDTVVFDKTGTLTQGRFAVGDVHAVGAGDALLHMAAHAECRSTHPIAAALVQAWPDLDADGCDVRDLRELAGLGVCATVNGQRVHVGNAKLMGSVGLRDVHCRQHPTAVHVAVGNDYAGHIVVADQPKAHAAEAIAALRREGIRRVLMLTGDARAVAEALGARLGVDEVRSELLPADKVAQLERWLADKRGLLAFVGDGINDAPALARADVGVAMGALGSDAAVAAADVVLMRDDLRQLVAARRLAAHTLTIVRENVALALLAKAACLLLGTLGSVSMAVAVFADVGVMLLTVLNALRALRPPST